MSVIRKIGDSSYIQSFQSWSGKSHLSHWIRMMLLGCPMGTCAHAPSTSSWPTPCPSSPLNILKKRRLTTRTDKPRDYMAYPWKTAGTFEFFLVIWCRIIFPSLNHTGSTLHAIPRHIDHIYPPGKLPVAHHFYFNAPNAQSWPHRSCPTNKPSWPGRISPLGGGGHTRTISPIRNFWTECPHQVQSQSQLTISPGLAHSTILSCLMASNMFPLTLCMPGQMAHAFWRSTDARICSRMLKKYWTRILQPFFVFSFWIWKFELSTCCMASLIAVAGAFQRPAPPPHVWACFFAQRFALGVENLKPPCERMEGRIEETGTLDDQMTAHNPGSGSSIWSPKKKAIWRCLLGSIWFHFFRAWISSRGCHPETVPRPKKNTQKNAILPRSK